MLPHAQIHPRPAPAPRLAVLDEAATAACEAPIEHTKALAFTFAFLANGSDDSAFADLWRELAAPLTGNAATEFGRRQTINSLVAYIFRLHGRVRPVIGDANG